MEDGTTAATNQADQSQKDLAGVVVYRPEKATLLNLVARVSDEVAGIILFLNSPMPDWLSECASVRSVSVLGTGDNVGVGAAHNAIATFARERGHRYVLLFDQDSLPETGMVPCLHRTMERLRAANLNPAVVGPSIVAAAGISPRSPRAIHIPTDIPQIHAVPFVISSGTLMNLDAFTPVGPFREDFFVDFVEVEWCARARMHGYTCWVAENTSLTHNFGSGVRLLPISGLTVTKHPPLRSYTFIRNQLAMLRLPHIDPYEKLRILVRCGFHTVTAPAISEKPSATIYQVLRGWFDGVCNRLGPP